MVNNGLFIVYLDHEIKSCLYDLLREADGKLNSQELLCKIIRDAHAQLVQKKMRNVELVANDYSSIKLSRRQKEIIPLLDQGLSNAEIAISLKINEHTVKVHLWRLYKKLKVKNRVKAVYLAKLNGLV